jgi:hypothetical protein
LTISCIGPVGHRRQWKTAGSREENLLAICAA